MTNKWNRCDTHKINYPEGGYCPTCSDKPPLRIVQVMAFGENNEELTALTSDGRLFHGYWRMSGDFYWAAEMTPDKDKLNRLPKLTVYSEAEKNQDD